jgi:hypothetical protein
MKKPLFVAATALVLASLSACGGGEDADPGVANTFLTYSVQVDRQEAKVGVNVAAAADFVTFGPTIKQAYWLYEPMGDATGQLSISDDACVNAQVNVQTAAGSDKKRATWRCETSVRGLAGAKGKFRLVATAVDSDGNTAKDDIVLTITP